MLPYLCQISCWIAVSSNLYMGLGDDTHTSARRELILSAVFFAFFVGAIAARVVLG